ncbi:hypothetical protein J4408_01755 [Candidatus Pacearchaeota archaeon]|nr:hypothetical protein [Candidatus Pacearchaeota archaeon]
MKYNMKKYGMFIVLIFGIVLLSNFALAAVNSNPQVTSVDATVCCEKTQSGLYCQDVPASECAANSRQVPTSCTSTSFCRQGFCYDTTEGTCSDNTPQLVCNAEGGIWNEEKPAQCGLGCCVLGDQAAFVTLVRCKKLSSFLGLKTNYNNQIKDEVQCVLSVQNQQKGACVFDFEFERTCKFTTKAECEGGVGGGDNSTGLLGEFFPSKLCSADELDTNCGPTRNTICAPGKDEVYFVDSCGNTANIYDASKVNDKAYWSNVIDKSEACNPNSPNPNSAACGNCNYLLGSYCREASSETSRPTYGTNICADLNCKKTSNGQSYKHGESWCVYDDEGSIDEGKNAVGSRFYKHVCINGEEVVEACADYRQEECVEDKIETTQGEFAQAACRVNRWQDCTAQRDQLDCENIDRRDCLWLPGKFNVAFINGTQSGVCVPKNTPGLKFWESEEAKGICAQGNAICIVTFEKGLFGDAKCKSGCECLAETWEQKQAELCTALGDCGPNINWVGQPGYRAGYKKIIEKYKGGK